MQAVKNKGATGRVADPRQVDLFSAELEQALANVLADKQHREIAAVSVAGMQETADLAKINAAEAAKAAVEALNRIPKAKKTKDIWEKERLTKLGAVTGPRIVINRSDGSLDVKEIKPATKTNAVAAAETRKADPFTAFMNAVSSMNKGKTADWSASDAKEAELNAERKRGRYGKDTEEVDDEDLAEASSRRKVRP